MSEIKGYVVRGQWRDGHIVHAFWWPTIERVHWTVDPNVVPDDATLLFATLGEAIAAMLKSSHLADVTIYAVHADGTEERLPPYEEVLTLLRSALDEIDRVRAELDTWRAAALYAAQRVDGSPEDVRNSADAWQRMHAAALDHSREVEESRADALGQLAAVDAALTAAIGGAKDRGPTDKVTALGARVDYWLHAWEQMKANRDSRDKAWARLLKAEMEGKLDTADAAKQALRDLNVDVDALLEEAAS